MKTLFESLFDIDSNIDNIDYDVSSMGKMGIKSIVVKIFDGKDITDDKNIKSVFRGCSPKIFKEIDTKVFEKNVHILDKYWKDLPINKESTKVIYTIAERCCQEVLYAQENHKGMVDAYMNDWIKKVFNGVDHKFQYWRKSKTFSIFFCPKKGDMVVRLICSARTK